MYEKSAKPTWTTDDLERAVKRANKALKGSATPHTNQNVAQRAASYTTPTWTVIEAYIKGLTPEQRIDHGFPNRVETTTSPRMTGRPDMQTVSRLQLPGRRR